MNKVLSLQFLCAMSTKNATGLSDVDKLQERVSVLENDPTEAGFSGLMQFVKLHTDDLCTVLRGAAMAGHIHVIEYCIENGVGNSYEALTVSARHGHSHVVSMMLDADLHNAWTDSALFHAVARGHTNVVKVVIASGRTSDRWRNDCAEIAFQKGYQDIMDMLLAVIR